MARPRQQQPQSSSARLGKKEVIFNARGCFNDAAYAAMTTILRLEPGISARLLARRLNTSPTTASFWKDSKLRPSQIAAAAARKKVPQTAAKRKEITTRRTQVKKLLLQRNVKKSDKKQHVTHPFGSVRLASRALNKVAHPHRSKSTVHRDARALGLVNRSRRRVPQQLDGDPKLRKAFAVQLKRLLAEGTVILFSDEKKFDSQDHGSRTQWVMRGTSTDPRHRSQAAHSVHVWGVISTDPSLCRIVVHDGIDTKAPPAKRGRPRKGEVRPAKPKARTVNGQTYIDRCLKPFFGKMATATKKKFLFMQDGARCHTCKVATQYLSSNGVKLLEGWPARSPDLNPIEKLWSIMSKRVSDRGPMDKESLEKFVVEEFNSIVADKLTIPNLINGLPKRCAAVIRQEGAIV